ncbi:hypothetical protein BU23DRAFT_626216 [Bimuria novae-zelandiae CBS 107.79]|uniref:F-box domain-containing protein n=1 Tax=Bimuria novae-zelandiae CBS 107.79 TaxID=1447943 RepID=A0A6A5VHT6_9PLEO|nr:hypothetical protein BU23DRAFT_626216 [Bimuria novae-zelandiae CBS 107.79]
MHCRTTNHLNASVMMVCPPGSLFLPDILPCPGQGRCEFHSNIFGSSADLKDVPESWYCMRCEKEHRTTVEPMPKIVADSPSRLETLPTELIQHIVSYLPHDLPVMLGCLNRTLYHKVGSARLKANNNHWINPYTWNELEKDTPAWAPCIDCQTFRPYTSEHAWPCLKMHRAGDRIPSTVYGFSAFLERKVIEYYQHDGQFEICSSLLACAGTCHKPLSSSDRGVLDHAGFQDLCTDLGIPIHYEAQPRILRSGSSFTVLVHIQYRISIPLPWTSFSTSQRYAILRKLYLCPHVYASKVQYRDPDDATFPADSSIAHWLPHQGPVPEARCHCSQCPSVFLSNFNIKDDQGRDQIVFDVWKTSAKRCDDNIPENTLCQNRDKWRPNRAELWSFKRAKPI